MTTASIEEVISCMVLGVMPKVNSKGDDYLQFEVKRDDDDFPKKYSAWTITPELQALASQPNTRHNLRIKRGQLKREKVDNGMHFNYFWEVVGVSSGGPPPVAAQPSRQEGQIEGRSHVQSPSATDPRQVSIERQVALKAAVHAAGTVWGDYKTSEQFILQVSELFYGFWHLLDERAPSHTVAAEPPPGHVQPPQDRQQASVPDDPFGPGPLD